MQTRNVAKARIKDELGLAALADVEAAVDAARELASGADPVATDRDQLATAVRYTLQLLEIATPGNTVEVRVPPFGAIQCIEGPRHTRGTPPNVIEMDPLTWLAIVTGRSSWEQQVAAGAIHCSGIRASLADLVPLAQWRV